MTKAFIDSVRARVEYTLEPTVLAQCGTTTALMQQYVARAYEPGEDVLVSLALRLHVPIPPEVLDRWRSSSGKAA
jgi:hypothetical protein